MFFFSTTVMKLRAPFGIAGPMPHCSIISSSLKHQIVANDILLRSTARPRPLLEDVVFLKSKFMFSTLLYAPDGAFIRSIAINSIEKFTQDMSIGSFCLEMYGGPKTFVAGDLKFMTLITPIMPYKILF